MFAEAENTELQELLSQVQALRSGGGGGGGTSADTSVDDPAYTSGGDRTATTSSSTGAATAAPARTPFQNLGDQLLRAASTHTTPGATTTTTMMRPTGIITAAAATTFMSPDGVKSGLNFPVDGGNVINMNDANSSTTTAGGGLRKGSYTLSQTLFGVPGSTHAQYQQQQQYMDPINLNHNSSNSGGGGGPQRYTPTATNITLSASDTADDFRRMTGTATPPTVGKPVTATTTTATGVYPFYTSAVVGAAGGSAAFSTSPAHGLSGTPATVARRPLSADQSINTNDSSTCGGGAFRVTGSSDEGRGGRLSGGFPRHGSIGGGGNVYSSLEEAFATAGPPLRTTANNTMTTTTVDAHYIATDDALALERLGLTGGDGGYSQPARQSISPLLYSGSGGGGGALRPLPQRFHASNTTTTTTNSVAAAMMMMIQQQQQSGGGGGFESNDGGTFTSINHINNPSTPGGGGGQSFFSSPYVQTLPTTTATGMGLLTRNVPFAADPSEPQPSLRPRVASKHSTPQANRTGGGGGGGALDPFSTPGGGGGGGVSAGNSATRAATLRYFTVPSPQRPGLGIGGVGAASEGNNNHHHHSSSGSGVVAGPPRILTNNTNTNSGGGGGGRVFISSIAAQLGSSNATGGNSSNSNNQSPIPFTPTTPNGGSGGAAAAFASVANTTPMLSGYNTNNSQQQQYGSGGGVGSYPCRRPLSTGNSTRTGSGGNNRAISPTNNSSSNSNHHHGGGGTSASSSSSPVLNLAAVIPLLLLLPHPSSDDGSYNGNSAALSPAVVHKVLVMCRDQHGCRQLQNILTKEIIDPTTEENSSGFAESYNRFEALYSGSGSGGGMSDGGHTNINSTATTSVGSGSPRGSSPFSRVAALSEETKTAHYRRSLLISVIVRAVQESFALVMADGYGNFLIQKIFEIAPRAERVRILAASSSSSSSSVAAAASADHHLASGVPSLSSALHNTTTNSNSFFDNVIHIACSPHGTFALQRLIETIKTEDEEAFIFAAMFGEHTNTNTGNNTVSGRKGAKLDGEIMRLFTDANGGHVLYKLMAYLKSRYVTHGSTNSNSGSMEDTYTTSSSSNGTAAAAAATAAAAAAAATATAAAAGVVVVPPAEKVSRRLRSFHAFLCSNLFFVCTHRQGCCVVQKYIDFLGEVFPLAPRHNIIIINNCFSDLVQRVIELSPSLVVNPYGNYVVTHLIEACFLQGNYALVRDVFARLHRRVYFYCGNKFASNVVEKILRYVSEEEIRAVCASLMLPVTRADEEEVASSGGSNSNSGGGGVASRGIKHTANNSGIMALSSSPHGTGAAGGRTRLELLALDPYGNYVVQTLLGVAPVDLLLQLSDGNPNNNEDGMLHVLAKVLPEMKERNFGKKIATKMELAMLRVREQHQQQQQQQQHYQRMHM